MHVQYDPPPYQLCSLCSGLVFPVAHFLANLCWLHGVRYSVIDGVNDLGEHDLSLVSLLSGAPPLFFSLRVVPSTCKTGKKGIETELFFCEPVAYRELDFLPQFLVH